MKSGKQLIYWDTCVFIAWLKDEKHIWPASVIQGIQHIADLVMANQAILLTSTLIRAEIFLSNLTLEEKRAFQGVLRRSNVMEIAPDMRITDRASSIRKHYNTPPREKIKTPDAIHLATAIIYSADEMQTMDGFDVSGNHKGLLALNGNVAGYALKIMPPSPRIVAAPPQPQPDVPIAQPGLFDGRTADEQEDDDEEEH
jgi:predicted nucleic acid-binding protein